MFDSRALFLKLSELRERITFWRGNSDRHELSTWRHLRQATTGAALAGN
jgi:hypothetical protein